MNKVLGLSKLCSTVNENIKQQSDNVEAFLNSH